MALSVRAVARVPATATPVVVTMIMVASAREHRARARTSASFDSLGDGSLWLYNCRIASSRSTTSSNFRARGYLCMFFVVCCLRRCPSAPPGLVLQQKIHSGGCSCSLLLLLLCVVCCGESRLQHPSFSSTRGGVVGCVVVLSYVHTHTARLAQITRGGAARR